MKYKNTTPRSIYVTLDGTTQLIQPGQEVVSESSLISFGLTSLPTAKPEKVSTPKPAPKEKKATLKPKSINTNEFTTTRTSKD